MSHEVLKIGRVIEVNGSRTIGELEANVDDLYRTYKSQKYTIGQVGSIVKIESGDILIFGIVTSLRMAEVETSISSNEVKTLTPTSKWIEIELFGQGIKKSLGEADFDFERGISSYPLPGQNIYLATIIELRRIYAKPDKPTVRVGTISQVGGLPIHLLIDDLLGKHFAVLGTTGSGKSCAVAIILQNIISKYPYAHIILLDPHNEYPRAFPEKAELIDPTTLNIPHWLLNFEESVELFIGKTEYAATRQTNILKDAILESRKKFNESKIVDEKITVDTPIPYKLNDLIGFIESDIQEKGLTTSKAESHQKIIDKVRLLMDDKRFEFLLIPDEKVIDNLSDTISGYFRIPVNKKPLSIIDLSGVPSDVVDVVVSVLCRTIFDFSLWNKERNRMPLLLVCEEAHRYAPRAEEAAFKPTKLAISRIAKEGRKYGVGLALVTQRPSELSESIISQCNSFIALRMSNEQDQRFVKSALPDSVKSLVDTLPVLRTREALIVGEGTAVPVRVFFDEIPENLRPQSSDVPFAEPWQEDKSKKDDVKNTVKRWREQKRES